MAKRKHPRGRMSDLSIRREIAQIQRELRNKTLNFTGPQRFKLHERVAELQRELRAIEIERLEGLLGEQGKAENPPAPSANESSKPWRPSEFRP